MFSYWFDPIPAGESRTCTYRIQFLPSTLESFETDWLVSSYANDDDVDGSNNRFEYTFIAPSGVSVSIPVPMLSSASLLILGLGLLLMVHWKRAFTAGTAEPTRPTRNREPSNCNSDPPPAATVWISSIGARTRTPATIVSLVRS